MAKSKKAFFERRSHPRQKKSLGQVFLKDEWPCTKMAENIKSYGVTHVLEIGPGAAALTKHLVKFGFHVTCVEKDSRFVELMVSCLI